MISFWFLRVLVISILLIVNIFPIAITLHHFILRYSVNLNVIVIYMDYRSDRSRSETPQWGKAIAYPSTEFTHPLLFILAYFLSLQFHLLWTVSFIYLLFIVSSLCYCLLFICSSSTSTPLPFQFRSPSPSPSLFPHCVALDSRFWFWFWSTGRLLRPIHTQLPSKKTNSPTK